MDTVRKEVKQKDIADVVKNWLNIKASNTKDSIRQQKRFNVAFVPAAGYSLQTRFAVVLAGNATFFKKHDSDRRLSVITASATYTQNKQLFIPVQTSIWTKGNRFNLSGDWRIMRYPQDTYGLGGHSSLDSANHQDYKYLRIYETVFREVSHNFYVGLGYAYDYHWAITEEGNPGGSKSDYKKYGAKEKTISSGPVAALLYDNRRNPINPQKGSYGNIIYRYNFKSLGSDENWQSLIIDVRKYFHLPARSKNVLAFWNYDWLTLQGDPPYLDLPSTSWDPNTNTGRGYIQGRFRSKNMIYFETEYRFGLTANGLLGAVVFVNMQAMSEWPSNKFETLQPGTGVGLRIKLNKGSNTNIDLDYGFGTGGSKGLTVNIGEIF
jgi:outer membrane protein assembly factor BamA